MTRSDPPPGRAVPGEWAAPDSLATEAFERLGTDPPVDRDGVTRLVDAIGRRLPRGSTTKLDAVAAGRRPPGDDPAAVLHRWLDDSHATWTCWSTCAVTAALIRAGGILEAQVVAGRRCEAGAPPVDFHSHVRVRDSRREWICDPYFGVGPLPVTGGRTARPGVGASLTEGPDGRFELEVATCSAPAPALRYRQLTGPLDPGDVQAFCDVSVTHSGLSQHPRAFLLLPDGAATLRGEVTDGHQPVEMRLWRPAGGDIHGVEPQRRWFTSWGAGMEALHEEAG